MTEPCNQDSCSPTYWLVNLKEAFNVYKFQFLQIKDNNSYFMVIMNFYLAECLAQNDYY
jgi:hypothetical protein